MDLNKPMMMCDSSSHFTGISKEMPVVLPEAKIVRIKKPRKTAASESKLLDAPLHQETSDQPIYSVKELIDLETEIFNSSKNATHSTGSNLQQDEILSHLGSYIEDPYDIIESYFRGQHLERLVRHQIESYNNFVGYQLPRTIQMFNPVIIRSENDYIEERGKYFLEMHVSFENFKLYPPQIHENNGATKIMFPHEAKLRNFTYASTMTIDINIQYIVRNTENMDNPKVITKTLQKINIGKMPIMLKSSICMLNQNRYIHPNLMGECQMDCGGYFIVKGSEKTVLGQERAAENRVYCFESKNTTKWSLFAEIKSIPDYKCISPKQIEMMISSKNNGFGNGIYINIPRVKQPIELFVLFRALGVLNDKSICEYILLDIDNEHQKPMLDCLRASIVDANKYPNQEVSMRHITAYVAYTPINMDKEKGQKKKLEFAQEVLNNDLFPHCSTLKQKLYLLGYMANKLLRAHLGLIPLDDRDSYLNKRIELTGTLLNNLFRNYFNKLVKEMQKQVVREINNGSWRSTEDYENIINMTNIYKIMKSTTIENGINRALSTGDFSIKQSNSSKVGVAQVLNRLTYVASLSHLRRINTPLEKSGELIAPRKLHNTTWGFLCPAETPEGQSIGVVKNISYMCHVTIPTNSSSLYEYIFPNVIRVDTADPKELHGKVKVFINGTWIGVSSDPMQLYRDMKDKKYRGIINIYTSIVFDFKMMEIRICNDGGRLTRPVLKVRDGKALLTKDIVNKIVSNELSWNDLLTNCRIDESVIEYIDPEEQNYSMIAMKAKDGYLRPDSSKVNYTHCEIHPSTIFGVLASCTPYPDHNQAPRNTYQCLGPNELVWLSNGSKKAIKDLSIGEKVLSFHPTTLDITETTVVNHFVRPNENPIYKLKTVSGREIIATEDHKFMTNCGWKTVEEMKQNINSYKIGISMDSPIFNVDTSVENETLLEIVLSVETFTNKLENAGIKESLIKKYVKCLVGQKLLPVYKNGANLNILSRISGYLLSDGSINIYIRNGSAFTQCQFDFGQFNDAVSFEHDVSLLGFDRCKILEGTREFNNIVHQTFHTSHNGALPALLICLDLSYGKKTETPRKEIPNWIMSGTKEIRREFLKGFQGGDGCKIRWNKMNKNGYNFICGETSQQINPMYKDSLKTFMLQCIEILRENAISVGDVSEKKISDDRVKISFKMSDSMENLMNYYDTIGYAYCRTKNAQSFKIVEYFKTKNIFTQNRINQVESIRKMNKSGLSNSEIASTLDLSCNYVRDTVRSYKNGRKISTPNIKECNIENWINVDVEEKNNCLFIPIESITKEPDGLISDIEVASENHSFIAGSSFLSSNCAMAKQAMGVYATNFDQRMDKTAYVLTYPSRPLVETRVMNFIQLNKIPSGCQIHVAIMSHTGYNQEDSVLINKGSIDRGLFMTTIYHTEKDEDKNIIRDEIIRCNPDPSKTKGIKFGNYTKLNSQGFIPENSLVENRDVIIAKIVPIKENRNDPTKTVKYEDQSKIYRTSEETYIDKNYTGRNGDGYNFAKVRVRILRKPVLGDKCSSRHGQKGTMGNIIPECDMPFTKEGIRPDIIINPHAIPSRMTIGQLKETLLGKVLLELGLFGDGTSFGNLDVKTISKELQKLGYESYGNEVLYNGLTGEQLETNIFFGPVFYQRLKHMVNDKQHSRAIGPMVNLTRQPAEGRSRDGGFRIGEMERDVMLAHGMSRFCRERLYDVSDKYSVHVCKKCGMMASYNDGTQNRMFAKSDFTIHLCRTCDNMTDFARVEIPYAYKLMAQELQTINVVPRIITE